MTMRDWSDSDEDASEWDSATGCSMTETTHSGVDNPSEYGVAKDGAKAVNRSKGLVFLVIALAALTIGLATYLFTKYEEHADFTSQFNDYAVEIVDSVNHETLNMFTAVAAFGNTITSYSVETGGRWPNITVPDFEIRGFKNNELSHALQISLAPLVTAPNRSQWETYSVDNQEWLSESLQMQHQIEATETSRRLRELVEDVPPISRRVWRYSDGDSGVPVPQDGPGVDVGPGNYAPVWQQSPAPHDPTIINYDLLSHPVFNRVYHGMWETRLPVLSEVINLEFLYGGAVSVDSEHPHSFLLSPVYPFFTEENEVHEPENLSAFLVAVIPWDSYFSNLLVEGVTGVVVVLHGTCGDYFTYQIDGPQAIFLGEGDLHDTYYDDMEIDADFAPFLKYNFSDTHAPCEYDLRIFPSQTLEEQYQTSKPAIYTAVVVLVFFFTALFFVLYDILIQRRKDKVVATANRTNAIVSSLFPSNVRDRILKEAEEQAEQEVNGNKRMSMLGAGAKSKLKVFLNEENEAKNAFDTKPIADLFPNTTVMFADIVGFTAWSSVREPSQVFTLLETLFAAFDEVASRRRVFKVETIGDCYVAVAGLPDPRKDHALVMARFARDVLYKMNELTKRLEMMLGPDTGDLRMRVGLHSGPVTAGVLRGEKSRFQLFGETVNTASKIESAGARNRVHLSQETADLLISAGKDHWVERREDKKIEAKDKGEMQTYWLVLGKSATSSHSNTDWSSHDDEIDATSQRDDDDENHTDAKKKKKKISLGFEFNDRTQRLVDWNSEVLGRLLKQVIAHRLGSESHRVEGDSDSFLNEQLIRGDGETVLDEVSEIIRLPDFDAHASRNQIDPDSIDLGENVTTQLHDFVTIIATMYRDNPFHNFEHASHVTMSVIKLLSRIVAPEGLPIEEELDSSGLHDHKFASTLHDHTYGITSDPLTQFACVFAALIHDVDHSGVPNAQLVKENACIATAYKNMSVAEQNSVDISWNLLMDVQFSDLRKAIYANQDEQRRFRQLVVNSVMATDIVDKELKNLRNARWEKAFSEASTEESEKDTTDRKATIVIEHLIQASDIAHTMQHWHIYRKWNERLFHELYKAYKNGRSETDPSEFWYQGELGFFDFYIIPLAKKLKDCGVFGVSSDEYLNYAQQNRSEFESRGREVVESMTEKYRKQYKYYKPIADEVQE